MFVRVFLSLILLSRVGRGLATTNRRSLGDKGSVGVQEL